MQQGYNGWANYATWRVNLEIIDGLDPLDLWGEETCRDLGELEDAVECLVEETVFSEGGSELMESYARSFLQEVDYREIAEHLQHDLELPEVENDD